MSAKTLYDRIASFYDDDMGRNMRFDDVGFYTALARQEAGRVLEIGVGTGRIAGALLGAGIDVVGIDSSRPMLDHFIGRTRECQRSPWVVQADMRALPLTGPFAVVLFPYSVLCYLENAEQVRQALSEAKRVLHPQGLLALDAFVPRSLPTRETFELDYERSTDQGLLRRERRVRALGDGRQEVQRRYWLKQHEDHCVETTAIVRPLTPGDLRAMTAEFDLSVEREVWDYGAATADTAQFCTLLARGRISESVK